MFSRSRIVANELIKLAGAAGKPLTPLQVIKLSYIAHGWMLGLYQRPLVTDQIEAWRYGPVIPDLYHQMKNYGSGYVTQPLPPMAGDASEPLAALDDEEVSLISRVYNSYSKQTGIQLSALTHQPGTPWFITWESQGQNSAISNDLIAEHYRRLADERRINS